MPTETVPTAETIRPMTPPPAPLARNSIGRTPLLIRLEKFWREDSPFLIAGLGLLVGAPVAYQAAAGGDPVSTSRPGLFGQTNEGGLNDMAPGSPVTGLTDSDPASLIMSPSAIRQAPTGARNSFPGGAALRAAAGAAVASAGISIPKPDATRAARDFSRQVAGAPVQLHLEAPTLPGLGNMSASSSASLARAADTVIGRDNGTGMIVRDLKALGGKLAWHGSGSAESAFIAGQRQAQGMNSSGIGALFTNGGGSGIGGGGTAASGGGIGHEGSQGGPSGGGAPAVDGKSVSGTTPANAEHQQDKQQPQMPSMPGGGGGGDKKKQDEQAKQGAQICQDLNQAGFGQAPAGASAVDNAADTTSAQQMCGKQKNLLAYKAKTYKGKYVQAYKQCEAYCKSLGM